MGQPRACQIIQSAVFRRSSASGAGKQGERNGRLFLFLVCIVLTPMLMVGCSGMKGGFHDKAAFEEANDLFSQGKYQASLDKYEHLIEKEPTARDRVLFEMGIIYSHPKNEHKDYAKSLDCFQKLITGYPGSDYRPNSEMMVFTINNVIFKDRLIAEQQAQIGVLHQEAKGKDNEVATLHQRIMALEQNVLDFATRKRSVDRIVIEKKERRLMLISTGEVLKTYKIALGGNPDGPKERQGDNKTPEGTYVIDGKNKNSQYHQALHVSYPNERDKKRAKELGVSPGGDIMIHGIKTGFSWVGDLQANKDWTKGCIAVTDEEIEEIYKLVPLNTVVEIRP
ncbi:L,D-transpeptidase family protein [Oryzomonas japonica]|uniref:L,D-transpeptidase family protein n=1 Tax=Oryzomonas japonica TaxID=2603858 RepID=A0A7J4ZNZ2_9BACT|nr:L,D-transpeptidase family protein [Oryzomonas japonica]KAB0664278.1 L,D-transpeptidase family protein [Oryzomonas japonica]